MANPYAYDGDNTVNALGTPAITFSFTGPPGFDVNPTTGVVSWSPTVSQVGSHPVTITATNAFGANTQSFTITVSAASSWQVITFDNFESGMGSYTDGGSDMSRYTGGTHAHQGVAAADIQDNSGVASSFYHTASYNVTGYTTLEVDFWFKMVSMETNEDFWVQYFNGTTWQTVATFARGATYQNNIFYHQVVTISSGTYNFPTNAKLRFRCDASDNNDDVYIDEIEFRGSTGGALAKDGSSLSATETLPESFELMQNYPNPFNPSTTISFALSEAGEVSLAIYNMNGQLVKQVATGNFASGHHQVLWDGRDQSGNVVATGVYFYRLAVNGENGEAVFTQTRRMAFVK